MLNVTRILFIVQMGLLFLNMLLSGVQGGNFFPTDALENFADIFFVIISIFERGIFKGWLAKK